MVENGLKKDSKLPLLGIRHLQTFLLFLGIATALSMRVNLSVAIVAMTDKNSKHIVEYTPTQKSLILSSFLWGYVFTQIPGGHFAKKLGGKVTLLFAIVVSSLLSLVTPYIAMLGDWRFPFAVRVLQGMSQGALFPSTHTLLAKWAPKEERGTLGTFAYCGGQFGTVAMFAGSGLIAASPMGWPGVFYVPGCLGLVWATIWFIWGSSSPSEHKTITAIERSYIEKSVAHDDDDDDADDDAAATPNHAKHHHHPPTPWMKFFKSLPFWALLMAHTAFCWLFWTLLTQIPSYMKNILHFNIKNNAILTSLPYLAMLLLNFVFTALASLISKRKWLNLTGSRKLFNTISTWIPAVALTCLGYLDANHTKLAVSLLVIAVGFGAAMHMGFMVNHIDLSPNFAGIMMGITNMISHVISIFAPLIVGFIVTEETNPVQWRIVFFIAAGFCFFGNLFFILYGSAKIQPFNNVVLDTTVTEEMQPMNKESKKT